MHRSLRLADTLSNHALLFRWVRPESFPSRVLAFPVTSRLNAYLLEIETGCAGIAAESERSTAFVQAPCSSMIGSCSCGLASELALTQLGSGSQAPFFRGSVF